VIQPDSSAQGEVWVRVANLATLDEVFQSNAINLGQVFPTGTTSAALFGELREVDGALLAGA